MIIPRYVTFRTAAEIDPRAIANGWARALVEREAERMRQASWEREGWVMRFKWSGREWGVTVRFQEIEEGVEFMAYLEEKVRCLLTASTYEPLLPTLELEPLLTEALEAVEGVSEITWQDPDED